VNVIYSNNIIVLQNVDFYIISIDDVKEESKNLILDMKDNTWLSNFQNNLIKRAYESRASKTASGNDSIP
jgi:hypothetical protein